MALPAIIAGLQAAYGIYRGVKAQKGLQALSQERQARFMDAAGPLQQNRQFGLQQMQQGIAPATKAIAEQTAAAQRAGQYRQITDMSGGQLSSAVSRIGALGNAQLGLGLAQQNQAARERGMGMAMSANQQLSSLQQRDIGVDIQQRQQTEQAYGQAKQQAFQDVLGAASGFAMMKMQLSEAEKNRDLYRQLGRIPGSSNAAVGAAPNQLSFSPMFRGAFPQPQPSSSLSMGDLYSLPNSMGGLGGYRTPATTGLPIDYATLPYSMGGTGGLRESYAPSEFGLSQMSQLPSTMGGYGGLGKKFTTPKSYINR
jgi:hypothetical protein